MSGIILFAATTGYQTRSFADACRRLNIGVTLATDRCHILEDPWRDQAIAIRFEQPDESAAIVAELAPSLGIQGIAAVADRPTVIAALTAEKLRLPWHTPRAALRCRDKTAMREAFAARGLLVPPFERLSLDTEFPQAPSHIGFPCMLKPLGLSASRGVIRADNPGEFSSAFRRIRAILNQHDIQRLHEDSNHSIQVEGYIPGREFAIEAIMTRGVLQPLAIFDKPDPLEGPFFEETIYVTPSRQPDAVQQAMIEATRQAAQALGLWHGPIHAEMRVNALGVYMLEIAARPIGGLCSRALRFETETNSTVSLEELIVLHAIGRMPSALRPARQSSGVMMIPVPRPGVFVSVEGVENAMAVPGIEDVVITVKPGEKLTPLPEGAGYTGFIFAGGDQPALVEQALRRAARRLTFHVLSALPVLP